MPPEASSKRPTRSRTAPVKAPRTWPKSSVSSSSPGSAAQLTTMKGPLRRGEWPWIARATTSLPVPLSPVRSTVASLCSSEEMSAKIRVIFGELATAPAKPLGESTPSSGSSLAGRMTTM